MTIRVRHHQNPDQRTLEVRWASKRNSVGYGYRDTANTQYHHHPYYSLSLSFSLAVQLPYYFKAFPLIPPHYSHRSLPIPIRINHRFLPTFPKATGPGHQRRKLTPPYLHIPTEIKSRRRTHLSLDYYPDLPAWVHATSSGTWHPWCEISRRSRLVHPRGLTLSL